MEKMEKINLEIPKLGKFFKETHTNVKTEDIRGYSVEDDFIAVRLHDNRIYHIYKDEWAEFAAHHTT